MDTPEKAQITTPISSKFEDSPVFSYINSLSPIKPVKTFNSLSFASPPSVFTSPHISYHKETRFFKRNHLIDPSRPDFSDSANEYHPSEGISDAVQLSDLCGKQLGRLSPGSSAKQIPSRAHKQHLELPKLLKYDCGSPDVNLLPRNKSETENAPEKEGTSASFIQFSVDGSKERHCSFESGIELGKIGPIEQNQEELGCDWEKLISDAADMLFFDLTTMEETSEGQGSKVGGSGTSCISTILELPQDTNGSFQKTEVGGSCIEHDMELQVTQLGDVAKLKETDQALESLTSTLLHRQIISDLNPEVNDKKDNCIQSGFKPGFQQQSSIRRLVFEMSGANKKRLIYNYGCGSSISSQTECKIALNEKQVVSTEPERGYSSPLIPGIGLHLNTLASTSKDSNLIRHGNLASGRQLRIMPSYNSFDPLASGRKGPNISLNHRPSEANLGSFCNEVQVTEDATSSFVVGEEFNQTSPNQKRCKSELAAESEGCKRCNCKKSKCLKLYCECFAAGLYCVEPCSCQDCYNNPFYEETVLETRKQIESRNPLAFAPKVIISSESIPEFGGESNKTPASARHKRGCNCKKSSCLKKYCECFQGSVGCSISCRCEGCKNPFGCKYGTEETELEVEETDACEKNALHTSLQNDVVQKGEELSDIVLPLMHSSEISSGKPMHSSLLSIGMCTSRKLEQSEFPCRLAKLEKPLQMIPEDETPDILQDSCSSTRGVESTSPNCKRVSPPHRKLGSSPAWRNGRKLILRSIPSFPSLNPRHEKH